MDKEIKLTKNEIQKISLDFRMIANRLIRTKSEEGISNLKRFINYIDSDQIISDFVQKHNCHYFDIESIASQYPHILFSLPDNSKEEEISFQYQLLKYALKTYYNQYDGYLFLAQSFFGYFGKSQDAIDKFNSSIVLPLYGYIENYITKLRIDIGDDENAKITIHIQGDNYGYNLGAYMTEMNINQNNSSIGVGVNQGEISAEKLAGSINEVEKYNLAEAAAEIQQLLQQLEQSYPANTIAEKMKLVAEAIERVETNPSLKKRVIAAFKKGGMKSFEKAINHPVASFFVGAIEGWQKGE